MQKTNTYLGTEQQEKQTMQTKPNQTKPNQTKPNQTKPNNTVVFLITFLEPTNFLVTIDLASSHIMSNY